LDCKAVPHVIIVEEVIHISTLGIDVLLAKDADILDEMQLET
jgi:hypothetical protein